MNANGYIKSVFSKFSLIIVLFLAASQTQAQTFPRSGSNLLITPTIPACYSTFSCEGSGWALSNAVQDYSTAQAEGYSIKLTSAGGYLSSTKIWPVTPASTYTFSFYLKSDANTPQALLTLIIQAYKNGAWNRNVMFPMQSVNRLAGGWQEVVATFQLAPDETAVGFKIDMTAQAKDAVSPASFWISNAYLGAGIGFDHAASAKTAFNGSFVKVDSEGNMSIAQNNQWVSFFPICVYADHNRPDWSIYKTQGFNCNMWSWDASEVQKAQQAGLYSGYQIARFISPSNESYKNYSALAADIDAINANSALKNNLLFYYWDNENDELPEWNVPGQVAKTIDMHDLDASYNRMRPLYSLQGQVGLARKYNQAGVVSGTTDGYGNVQSMSDTVGSYISRDSYTADGVTNYTQALDQIVLNNIEQQRQPVSIAIFNGDSAPTGGRYGIAQFKAAVYTAIAKGAKGIGYWRDCYQSCGTPNISAIEQTEWWNDFPALSAAIQSQLPVIQSPMSVSWSLLKTSPNDHVQTGIKTYSGKAYVIAANEGGSTANPQFSLSGLNYSPSVVINAFTRDSMATISAGSFTLPMQPNDGGFYLLGSNVPDAAALDLMFNGNLNDVSSANNSNGVLVGGSNVASLANNTLVLNGGYVQIPSQVLGFVSPSLEMSNNLTIAAKTNIDNSQTGYAAIVTKGAANPNTAGYAFFYDANNSKLNFWYGKGGSGAGDRNTMSAVVPSLKGAWHSVAVTATLSGTVTFYVDGVAYAGGGTVHSESPNTMINASQPMQIGAWYTGHYLKGSLDNVRLYKAALTAQEVAVLFN